MRKLPPFLLLRASLLLAWAFAFAVPLDAQTNPPAQHSFARWDAATQDIYVMKQVPFDFFWQNYLEPGAELPTPTLTTHPNKPFSELTNSDGKRLPDQTFGTYRLVLRDVPTFPKGLALSSLTGSGSARWILYPADNPSAALTFTTGTPGTDAATTSYRLRPVYMPFTPKAKGDWILLVQIANFTSGRISPIPFAIQVGEASAVQVDIIQSWANYLLSFGVMLAVAFYSLLVWLRRRADHTSLALFFLACAFACRTFSSYQWGLGSLDTYNKWGIVSNYFTQGLVSLSLIVYLVTGFPSVAKNKFSYTLIVLNGLWSLCALTFPDICALTMRYYLFPVVLLTFTYATVVSIRAARQNFEGAGWNAAGTGIFLFAVTTDVLNVLGVISSKISLNDWGIIFFLLFQAQVIAKRSALAYERAELYAKELVEKEKARTLFFHNTSHELRTPLSGIIGFLDLVLQGNYGLIPAGAQQQMQKALRLAEGLKYQVNTILDLAKSRRGEAKLNRSQFSLWSLKTSVDTMAEGLKIKSPDLHYTTEVLAGIDEDTQFCGDKAKIEAILRNLLGNAFKFRKADGPHHVALKLSYQDKTLLIEVNDSGIGIPEQYKKKVFEEFVQVEGDARRRFEGTGLGLSIVRDYVSLMHGSIQLESEIGKGSTFNITIPEQTTIDTIDEDTTSETLSFISPNEDTKLSTQSLILPNSRIGEGWRILVIDDTPSNCDLIKEILKADAFDVSYALSGAEGLKAMRNLRPHLVLLDMMMPEMSGEDVIRMMRSEPELEDIPVILVTARASDEDRIFGLKLGADDYLPKPIVARELRLRTQNIVHRHQLVRLTQKNEMQEKLIQLGELFSDLSHELKNIVHSSEVSRRLGPQDIDMALTLGGMEEQPRHALRQGLLNNKIHPDAVARMNKLPLDPQASEQAARRNLRLIVAQYDLAEESMLQIWQSIANRGEEELIFLDSQLRIMSQYQVVLEAMQRCRELTLGVMSYTRSSDHQLSCDLKAVYQSVVHLAQARIRKASVKVPPEVPQLSLAIAPSQLTQILLNLFLNACDAVESLDESQRWITLSVHEEKEVIELSVQNGGPPITSEQQNKLFERGFSTKGTNGTGIGLHVSRRLARSAQGDICYDVAAAHPTFILKLRASKDQGLKAETSNRMSA